MPPRFLALLAAVALCAAASACDGDDPDDGPPTSKTTSSPTAPETTADTSSPTEPPGEPAATGPVARFAVGTMHAPKGWELGITGPGGFTAVDPSTASTIVVTATPLIVEDQSLNEQAADLLDSPDFVYTKRLPDAEVDGEPAFHLTGTADGAREEAIGLAYGGRDLIINFTIEAGLRDPAATIDSVIASAELG